MLGGIFSLRHLMCVGACLLSSACASTQLNHNTADLASSLNSLTKKQIFFNLSQAIDDPEFVPSQVTISIGVAQTANSVSPSISVPLGPSLATATRFTSGGGRPTAQTTSTLGAASPSLGVQVTDAWNQSWTMVPANSSNQLGRLRTLYQYATGTLPHTAPNTELSQEEAEKQFLCEYPLQAQAVSPQSGNVIFKLHGCKDNHAGPLRPRIIHADPTFTQGPNCIVCIDDLNASSLRPYVNPNLKYHFIRAPDAKTGDLVRIGSYGSKDFYVCGVAGGKCPGVTGQAPYDGRKAFSDFILFVYEAMSVPAATGSGRSTGGSFVYSVR